VDSHVGHVRAHTSGNKGRPRAYSPPGAAPGLTGQPWRIQLSGGSDPAGTDSAAGWCWQSHQLPPGQSSWWRFRH